MADYAFRTIEDRRKIQEMWEEGRSPREIAGAFGKVQQSLERRGRKAGKPTTGKRAAGL